MLKMLLFISVFTASFLFATNPAQGDVKIDIKKAYKKKCSKCHGSSGEGIADKKNKPSINKLAKVEDKKLVKIITDGYKGKVGKMPGFGKKFTKEEIAALVKLVKSFDKK